jgi:hypothetical protein
MDVHHSFYCHVSHVSHVSHVRIDVHHSLCCHVSYVSDMRIDVHHWFGGVITGVAPPKRQQSPQLSSLLFDSFVTNTHKLKKLSSAID